jgi:WD40 repeat protein
MGASRNIRFMGARLHTVSFNNDDMKIVCGDVLGRVTIVDMITQQDALLRFYHHVAGVTSIVVSPDGSIIAAAAAHKKHVQIWNADFSQEIGRLSASPSCSSSALRVSPRGIGSGQQSNAASNGCQDAISPVMTAICFHPNGTIIAAGGEDGSVRVWTFSGLQICSLKVRVRFYERIMEVVMMIVMMMMMMMMMTMTMMMMMMMVTVMIVMMMMMMMMVMVIVMVLCIHTWLHIHE